MYLQLIGGADGDVCVDAFLGLALDEIGGFVVFAA